MKLRNTYKKNRGFIAILILGSLLWGISMALFISTSDNTREDLIETEIIREQEHYSLVLNHIFGELEKVEVFVNTVGVDGLTQENFDQFAEDNDFSGIGFVSFSIAPDGVVEYYYSDIYYNNVIGLDLVNDDRQHVKDAVAYAIANEVIVINGPFELIIGGRGLVFRQAIYEDGDFAAIINLVINYDNLDLLFTEFKSEVVDVGIYNIDNELIFGDLEYRNDIDYLEDIDIANVEWKLGIEESDEYAWNALAANVSLVTFTTILYFVVISLGVKYYSSNSRLLNEQDNMIHFDNLTSLPNRRLLSKDVEELIQLNKPFYLGFGDLDNFKNLNDILGHSVGDKYLRDISERFINLINDKLRIYRWGGDEFIFLMETSNKEETITVINSIYNIFKLPITVKDTNYYVSISIGIVNYPTHGITIDDLIKRADIVMYDIKSQQKNMYGFFESKYLDNLKREVDFENKVNEYTLDDFEVFLQPVLYTETQEVYGFEGLVRLFDETEQLINTHEIVKVFERKGEIFKLDKYVLEGVCKHSVTIKEKFNKQYNYTFNISPITLSKEFIIFLKEMIEKYQIDPNYFIVEIIETLGFKDMDDSIKLLEEMRTLGFRIAMDDFGMGYSSLSYITKLPLSIIKIDRHFVHNYHTNEFDKMIMLTIKDISKSLNIEIIVEGIETTEQLEFIKEIGAHYFQGYLHSKPMRITEVLKLLNNKEV